ncbi:hypothetical protein MHU86_11448 [Fragilaria crotonensis]|nr:hypothetical protein MHU86_11448 [Fragilaria crotonensis]
MLDLEFVLPLLSNGTTTITPAILMATSSVLIDATFRRELYRDRIWTQVILWLAVSLQTPSAELLVHGVFAAAICSCAYTVLLLKWSILLDAPDYTRLLGLSLLITLYWDACLPTESPRGNHWMAFLLIFASLASWLWYSNQRRRQRQHLVGMPLVTSTVNLSTTNLDECLWNQWTRSQVLQWIATLDDNWRSTVCCHLAPEAVTGSVLKGMTAEDLRSMGVSYGDARRLVNHIDGLISRYPERNQFCAEPQGDILKDWLGDDSPDVSIYQHQPPKSFMHETEALDEDVIKKANDMMKEKYGFELPEIRRKIPTEQFEFRDLAEHALPPTTETTTIAEDEAPTSAAPLTGLLASLPEHIREIAERKPELLQALWTAHQLEREDRPAPDPVRIRRLIQDSVSARSNAVETITQNEHQDDEETTGLLRKRTRNPKYASIL